jgi:hypothetical protein
MQLHDGWFISGNHIVWRNADTGGADRIVHSDGNWDSRIHNLSNSGDKRNIRQFFIRPDLFIEIRTDEPDTFRPVL